MSGDDWQPGDGSARRHFSKQIRDDLEKRKAEHCCERGVAREHCVDHRDDESEKR